MGTRDANLATTGIGYAKGVSAAKYEQVNKVFGSAWNRCQGVEGCAGVTLTGEYYADDPSSLFDIHMGMMDDGNNAILGDAGKPVEATITSGTNLDACAVHNTYKKVRAI